MPEENQNMGKSVSMLNNSSLRDYADSIVAFQNQARQEQMAKASVESDNNIKNLMTSWMTTTNHWVAQDCSRAARIWLVAKWIRDYFALPENWWKDYSNVPDVDLVDWYKASNPDSEKPIWKFVLDESQICDPNPLYQELGFYWNPQVEDTASVDVEEESDSLWEEMFGMWLKSLIDSMGAANDTALWLPRFASNVWADIAAESIKFFWGDEERANEAAEKVKSFWDKFSFWDKESLSYNTTKMVTDLILAYYMWKGLLPQSNIGNLWWGTKMALGGAEWAADMWLYSMISDSELPSKWEINLWFWLWTLIPWLWPVYKWGKKMVKNLLKKWAEREVEKTILSLTKLTESQQDKFLKEFWVPFQWWMREKWLNTWDDVINYWKEISNRKREWLSAIKWKFKSPEVEDVLNEVIDYAERTKDPNLNKLKAWKTEYDAGWLDMVTIDDVKQYFEFKRNFAYDENLASEIRDTLTNMDTALRERQRAVAKENWLDILADLNEEKRILYFLKEKAKDMTKIGKPWMTFKDFFVALSTGNFKWALSYLFTKDILNSPKFDKYWVKIMRKLLDSKSTDDLIVDFENIQKIQDEKEFLKWLEENWIMDDALPNIEWATSTPVGTVPTVDVSKWQEFITSPSWETWLKSANDWRNGIDFVK